MYVLLYHYCHHFIVYADVIVVTVVVKIWVMFKGKRVSQNWDLYIMSLEWIVFDRYVLGLVYDMQNELMELLALDVSWKIPFSG